MTKILAVVAAVVVIVVVILVGLDLGHVGPFSTSGSGTGTPGGGGGSGQTYTDAVATAQPSTSSVPGGAWTATAGISVDVATSHAVNSTDLTSLSSGAGCGAKLLSSSSSITSIPSTSTSASSGTSNAWIILFSNKTLAVLEVAVFSGTATPLLTLTSYGSCVSTTNALSLPSPLVNSPAAALVAYNSGGSAFISAHHLYDLAEILTPTVTISFGSFKHVLPAAWEISYTTCNMGADDGTTLGGEVAQGFVASVNASTGALVRALNESTVTCPSATPGGGGGGGGAKNTLKNVTYVFVLSQQHAGPGAFWNNGSLVTSLSSMTVGDLTVAIENNTTGAAVSTSGITLAVIGGFSFAVLSVYDFSTNTWNNTAVGFGTSASATHILSINSTMSLKGDKIVLTATSAAPATGSVSAPLGKP